MNDAESFANKLNLTLIGKIIIKKEITINEFSNKIKMSLKDFVLHLEEKSDGYFEFSKTFNYCTSNIKIIPFSSTLSTEEITIVDGYNIIIKTDNLKGNNLNKGLNDLSPYLHDLEMKNRDQLEMDKTTNSIECQFDELPQFVKYLSDLKLEDLTAKKDGFTVKILKDKITVEGEISSQTTDGISKMIKLSF